MDVQESVYRMLSGRNLTIISDVGRDIMCAICDNILVNARQGRCGCDYCEKCVSDHIRNGGNCCPGNKSDECRKNDLSETSPDHRINLKISRLIAKCPEGKCEYRCELVQMENHLKTCEERMVVCPWRDIGCCEEGMTGESVIEHLRKDVNYHNCLLMEELNNLRRELREMKENYENRENELEILKKDNQELKLNFNQNNEIETIKNTLSKKEEQIVLMDKELKLLRSERNDLAKMIENVTKEREEMTSVRSMQKEIKSLGDRLAAQQMVFDEVMNKSERELTARLEELEAFMNIKMKNGLYVWPIGELGRMKKSSWIESEYFYRHINCYRMKLYIWYDSIELNVWLYVYGKTNDVDLQWPMEAKVIMKILDNAHPGISSRVIKSCSISQPSRGSYQKSKPFLFLKSDLIIAGITNKTDCILECRVKFE